MPKRSAKQIEEDEKKIIKYLLTDARQSIDKIAKNCNFSRQKVWRIMKRLEEDKTIWGYTAIVDSNKLNEKNYTLLFKATHMSMSKEIANTVKNRTTEEKSKQIGVTIQSSYWINGYYDGMICFTAHNIKEAKQFCDLILITLKSHVSEVELLEKIFPLKQNYIENPRINDILAYYQQ